MGCLNSGKGFSHWFGNIHLSGPCNRSCYFCIGQHMQALDPLDNLGEWPLKNIDEFVARCIERGVTEVNVTGTNTDPLLYRHTRALREYLVVNIPGLIFGIRTNGALDRMDVLDQYDKGSITICSFDPVVYRAMMGSGSPPDLAAIVSRFTGNLKVNIVLGPENRGHDLLETIKCYAVAGVKRVNLREPYGQPHHGNPFADLEPGKITLGMPTYYIGGAEVTYWDVHYVEVESVNLYASGRVSLDYPITRGHDTATGRVYDQSRFPGGRVLPQWNGRRL